MAQLFSIDTVDYLVYTVLFYKDTKRSYRKFFALKCKITELYACNSNRD